MLILTSDGLSNDALLAEFQQHIAPHFKKAAIITTASNQFAEKHPDIERNIKLMEKFGLSSECVDIEKQEPEILKHFDIIIIIGGNPYYLLDVMQKKNCKPLFSELLADGKVILAMSAGSMVLGTSIDFVNLLTPQMDVGLDDYTGMSLADRVVCPHASTFVAGIENSAEKLAAYEKDNNIVITKIDDGQALFIA